MPRAAVVTFGCKVSQYESQAILERLARDGYEAAADPADADLVVLNTCTVTETAAREALSAARRIARRHPRARIAVAGCAAASHRAEFAAIPGVVGVAAPVERRPWDLSVSRLDGHARAFLKVQDGCDLNCSFCIIPRVRGPGAERPFDQALAEARRLAAAGHREIVLTGIHLGGFRRIPDLIAAMLDLPGLARVRLSSIEIHEVSGPLLDLIASRPDRVCPHLHVPLQSGDDAVLRAMRRRYNAAQFRRGVDRIRERVPRIGLTTDVIVGFPGETREAFGRTLDLCRWAGFHRIHGFSYSPRRGTDAAGLTDDVSRAEKRRRIRDLREAASASAASFAESLRGERVTVLVEKDGQGYTEHYLRARTGGRAGERVEGIAGRYEDGVLEVTA